MPIVATIAAIAAVIWGIVYARRGSLLLGVLVLLIVHYVFGHWFWNAHVGPLPLTIDRILLLGIGAAFVAKWRWGQLERKPICDADWLLAGLLIVLTTSATLFGNGTTLINSPSPFWRLIASFWIPASLYLIVKQAPFRHLHWKGYLIGFTGLGVYLAFTAIAEVSGQWWAVFPKYIANPELGTHFGRARGPILNSASLGLCLTVCLLCAWTLADQVGRRGRALLWTAMAFMAVGVYFTYTRSTWLGLAAGVFVMFVLRLPKQLRVPAIGSSVLAGLLVLSVAWSSIMGLKREGSAHESEHSVQQRSSFTHVSIEMFKDHPILGVGFGRFLDKKLPYLADRSQSFELESIRPLQHHNTFLSFLTETGMIGLAAFLVLLASWFRHAWSITHNTEKPTWVASQGMLTLAVLAAYLPTLLFHDVTQMPTEFWTLFVLVGMTIGLRQGVQPTEVVYLKKNATSNGNWLPNLAGTRQQVSQLMWSDFSRSEVSAEKQSKSVSLFGLQIDRLNMGEVIARIQNWCLESRSDVCRYIVTPNVDHVVMYQHRTDLREAYQDASLVLADGAPVVWASRLLRKPLPERVAGSDLVPALFSVVSQDTVENSESRNLNVFLLGAAPGVANEAARRIVKRWKGVRIVDTYSPPLGFENDEAESNRVLERIAEAKPDLLVVGLGAPKQELWVGQHHKQIQAKVALCVGATIDFLAGHRNRSPVWMQRVGLEWLHRVLSEPRRLASRYARDAWAFPQLCWRELCEQFSAE